MSFRVILRGPDGALLYSTAYDDKEGEIGGAEHWSRHEDLEVLRNEGDGGEVIAAETFFSA